LDCEKSRGYNSARLAGGPPFMNALFHGLGLTGMSYDTARSRPFCSKLDLRCSPPIHPSSLPSSPTFRPLPADIIIRAQLRKDDRILFSQPSRTGRPKMRQSIGALAGFITARDAQLLLGAEGGGHSSQMQIYRDPSLRGVRLQRALACMW
jgi:hypothetical protein